MKKFLILISFLFLPEAQEVHTELIGHIGRPAISPDGTRIAFIYAENEATEVREIYMANINGTKVERLTYFDKARIKKGPVWSPNGQKIAFHGDIDGGAQIFVLNADDKSLTQLTDLPGYNVEPHWSPDGSEIVFNTIRKEEKTEIFIMNKDGSAARPLKSPDGQNWYPRKTLNNRIIFTSDFEKTDNYNLYIMDQDGSDIRPLTNLEGINWFPEYSPDGTKIAFHSNKDDLQLSQSGDYNIYIMNGDGTGLRQLTSMPGQELHAKWYPSGDKLIFGWHNEGPKGIYTVNVATAEVEKLRLFKN